jgi:hypothetical protein
MDDLKLLREMRRDVPPPSPEILRAAEHRLMLAAGVPRRPADPGLTRIRLLRPRRFGRLAMAGGLSLAVITGAVAAQELQSSGSAAGGQRGNVKLAAWTVTRHADGLIDIYIRQLRDPAGLRAMLRRDGVPARVEFLQHEPTVYKHIPPQGCAYPSFPSVKADLTLENKIFPLPGGPPNKVGISHRPINLTFVIRPSAIPPDMGIFWQIWIAKAAKGFPSLSGNVDLVQASPSCTGGSRA